MKNFLLVLLLSLSLTNLSHADDLFRVKSIHSGNVEIETTREYGTGSCNKRLTKITYDHGSYYRFIKYILDERCNIMAVIKFDSRDELNKNIAKVDESDEGFCQLA